MIILAAALLMLLMCGVGGFFFLSRATNPVVFYFDAQKMLHILPAKIEQGVLSVKTGIFLGDKKSWIIEDAPQYPFKSGFFTKPAYICYYGCTKPLKVNEKVDQLDFMEAQTLDKLLNNRGIQKVASVTEGTSMELKLLLVGMGIMALIVVGYFIFVAPNMIPKDSCSQMVNIARDTAGVTLTQVA